jgi:hypothetical protein
VDLVDHLLAPRCPPAYNRTSLNIINHYIIVGGVTKTENTAKEPLDIAGVVDTPPQHFILSEIVDSNLVEAEISPEASSSEQSDGIHRGLSSFQYTANTGNTAVAGDQGEEVHLAKQEYIESTCGGHQASEEDTHGDSQEDQRDGW